MLSRVLCASDGSDLAPKLYRHAAGLAAATGASLAIVHVREAPNDNGTVLRLRDDYLRAIPCTGSVDLDPEVFVPSGNPVEGILLSAEGYRADLIVCGSRRRSAVASWLLGSTSRSLLEQTQTPLLMIPDNDFDIVSVGDTRATLHFGSVIAAVDRAASNRGQLTLASELAKVSGQPLTFLTVIEPGDATTLAEAEEDLRDRAHGLTPVRPHSLIVRRGNVAKEIVACCDAERAGVVVMGLRAKARGNRPGAIATAVLAHGSSAVLAVTDSP